MRKAARPDRMIIRLQKGAVGRDFPPSARLLFFSFQELLSAHARRIATSISHFRSGTLPPSCRLRTTSARLPEISGI